MTPQTNPSARHRVRRLAEVACFASVAINYLIVQAALIPGASPLRKKIVDDLGAPGETLGQWLHIPLGHDMVPFFIGSFLFYFAVFWVLLCAWAAVSGRFGTARRIGE
jgi:hypothetical protein